MRFVADLHVHSRYSRATSKDLDIPNMAQWAKWKGVDVVGTGDCYHPGWLNELKRDLEEDLEHGGLFKVRDRDFRERLGGEGSPRFMLSVETSHVYKQDERVRRVHLVTLLPSFDVADKIQQALLSRNVNLSSDGRPVMGLRCPDYMDLVLTIDDSAIVFPAHIWTPWYSMFGSMSGFDSFKECFNHFSPFVWAVESGLSSDPFMNWRVPDLDDKKILSFSDAHSPSKLGREVTFFEGEMSYAGIFDALKDGGKSNFVHSTVEFFPEEGKYHYSGHRKCEVCHSPQETKDKGEACPVCGQTITLGVMHRVEDLATRDIDFEQMLIEEDEYGVVWVNTPKKQKPSYTRTIPLVEMIAEIEGVGVKSKKVTNKYKQVLEVFNSELDVLLSVHTVDIEQKLGAELAEAVRRVRESDLSIDPGYDGEYGKVRVFKEGELDSMKKQKQPESLF